MSTQSTAPIIQLRNRCGVLRQEPLPSASLLSRLPFRFSLEIVHWDSTRYRCELCTRPTEPCDLERFGNLTSSAYQLSYMIITILGLNCCVLSHLNAAISTRPSGRNPTPSASSMARRSCAKPPPAMVPSCITTRCQGRPSGQIRMARPTSRAARGRPSIRAIWP